MARRAEVGRTIRLASIRAIGCALRGGLSGAHARIALRSRRLFPRGIDGLRNRASAARSRCKSGARGSPRYGGKATERLPGALEEMEEGMGKPGNNVGVLAPRHLYCREKARVQGAPSCVVSGQRRAA